jgi:hypothetical protein
MHDQPSGGGDPPTLTTDEADTREEQRVLREVLDYHPGTFTLEELIRELTGCSTRFGDRDAIERAVRDLAAVGLIHRRGDVLFPTRTAVYFYGLEEI